MATENQPHEIELPLPLSLTLTAEEMDEQLQLHGSDHPGMKIVTVPLDETNYSLWKISMITALEAKSKLSFVDGSFPEPDEKTGLLRK